MHKYNNQDHSMLTAMLTAENIVDGTHHDVWSVNVEEDYHEEASAAEAAPTPTGAATVPTGRGGAGTGREAPILPSRSRVVVDEEIPKEGVV
jgi:hypothetical protein